MSLSTGPGIAINTNLVKAQEFKSWKDLLEPRWKGKIILGRDPKIAGTSQAVFTFFFRHKDLGPEFIRALAKQKLTILQNDRQAFDWLGHGKVSVLLGPSETITQDMLIREVPIALVPPQQLREGGYLTSGPGTVMLINRAPHPNAARVYINWLLSKEGQVEYANATDMLSLRLDVPRKDIPSWRQPVPGYIENYSEEAMEVRARLLPLLKEVLE
jgi:ABC-type Fe3+ transport system substrate-binding protein